MIINHMPFEPFNSLIIFFVFWVLDDVYKAKVAWDAATVLRRASPLSGSTFRVLYSLFLDKDTLKENLVFPSVTKVVFVQCGLSRFSEMCSDRDFPSRQELVRFYFIIRNPNFDLLPLVQLGDGEIESMKMVIKPPHSILQSHM